MPEVGAAVVLAAKMGSLQNPLTCGILRRMKGVLTVLHAGQSASPSQRMKVFD